MNTVAQTCLNNVDLVLQYIEAQEKIESIAKDYDQQISQARKTKEQHSLNMSDQQIKDEFIRVSNIMTKQLTAAYQLQFNAQNKEFNDVIKELETHIKETKEFIDEYQKKISQLKPKLCRWYDEWQHCKKRISNSDLDELRDKCRKSDKNPYNSGVLNSIERIREYVKEIPEQYITIRVGNRIITSDKFLNDYTPTYTTKGEHGHYPDCIDIEIVPPTGVKGFFYGNVKKLMPFIKSNESAYNEYFEKFCIAKAYMDIFIKGNYEAEVKVLHSYEQNLTKYKRELPTHEKDLADVQQAYKDFLELKNFRKGIESGYIKALSKAELDKVKAKTLQEAVSKLHITHDDLLDYIALASSKENYGDFVTKCSQDRAKKYIESSNRKQSCIAILETEKAQKLSAIKIPNLELIFRKWNDEYPLYAQMGFPEQMDQESVEKTMEAIARTAAKNYGLKIFPNGDCFHLPTAGGLAKNAKGEYLWAPSFSSPNGSIPNLMLAYSVDSN